MRLTFLVIGFLGFQLMAVAQASDSTRWGSIHVAGGSYFVKDATLFRNDIAALVPILGLDDRNLMEYRFTDETFATGLGVFEIAVGYHPFGDTERRGPEVRAGISYAGTQNLRAGLDRTTRAPYDTLTSSQTGDQTFVDSVFSDRIRVQHTAQRVGLNAAIIWRSSGRWSVYGGVGVAGGPVLNARTEVWQDGNRDVAEREESTDDVDLIAPWDLPLPNTSEVYRNATGWWFSMYVPFGIDLQLARKKTFLSRVHFFIEVRPQLAHQGTPELGTRTSIGQQTLSGLRLEL
jgi:opacity protein-like surface antigen